MLTGSMTRSRAYPGQATLPKEPLAPAATPSYEPLGGQGSLDALHPAEDKLRIQGGGQKHQLPYGHQGPNLTLKGSWETWRHRRRKAGTVSKSENNPNITQSLACRGRSPKPGHMYRNELTRDVLQCLSVLRGSTDTLSPWSMFHLTHPPQLLPANALSGPPATSLRTTTHKPKPSQGSRPIPFLPIFPRLQVASRSPGV